MLKVYKTINGIMTPQKRIEKNCWVNIVNPADEELKLVSEMLCVKKELLCAALDEEESPRIEAQEDNRILLLVDIPVITENEGSLIYSTVPMGIICAESVIVTVCLKENSLVEDFARVRIKNADTGKKTRFILQLLYDVSAKYLQYLKQINKIQQGLERQLIKAMKNQELLQLLDLKKSLVYFSTSIKANEATIKKLSRGRAVTLYDDDQELLEDVLIEVGQAVEMCNIYSSILSETMDTFASIISNNLNVVMKYLASITIVISVPTMIASFYGMNVSNMPLAGLSGSFWIIVVISIIATVVAAIALIKNKMF